MATKTKDKKPRRVKKILAWKWVAADHKMLYGDGRELKAGRTFSAPLRVTVAFCRLSANAYQKIGHPKSIRACKYGIHASESAADAFKYRPNAGICDQHIARVELSGEIDKSTVSAKSRRIDKIAAQHCKVLWIADASSVLSELRDRYERAYPRDFAQYAGCVLCDGSLLYTRHKNPVCIGCYARNPSVSKWLHKELKKLAPKRVRQKQSRPANHSWQSRDSHGRFA